LTLRLWSNRLEYPLKWKKSRRIFVNSMSDLFHRDVPDEFVFQVFEVMVKANWHIFQVLTKRPARLVRLIPQISKRIAQITNQDSPWPRNIWIGVSVETSDYYWRIDCLRDVPSSVRFISAEPLLGSLQGINLADIHWVIVGGESGVNYRECHPTWVRELRNLCQVQDVAFFFKQWGGRTCKSGGRLLDGRTWDEFPLLNGNGKSRQQYYCTGLLELDFRR
jgi:protein gp37